MLNLQLCYTVTPVSCLQDHRLLEHTDEYVSAYNIMATVIWAKVFSVVSHC